MATMIDLILGNTNCNRPGLDFEDEVYTHGQIVRKAKTRAAALLAQGLHRPLHVGVLLENIPEALFWLEGIALAGGATVGINWTRRGAELARYIRHTDCQLVVTDNAGMQLLSNAGIEEIPIVVTDSPEFSEWLQPFESVEPTIPEVSERPLRPHLHIGHDQRPEGGDLHARPDRPAGVEHRCEVLGRRRRRLQRHALVPLQRDVHLSCAVHCRRIPPRHAPQILGVRVDRGREEVGSHLLQLRGQAARIHPRHAGMPGRRRQPAQDRYRERSQ